MAVLPNQDYGLESRIFVCLTFNKFARGVTRGLTPSYSPVFWCSTKVTHLQYHTSLHRETWNQADLNDNIPSPRLTSTGSTCGVRGPTLRGSVTVSSFVTDPPVSEVCAQVRGLLWPVLPQGQHAVLSFDVEHCYFLLVTGFG